MGRRHQLRENSGRKPKFSENDRRTFVSKIRTRNNYTENVLKSPLLAVCPSVRPSLSEFLSALNEQIKNCYTDFIKIYLIYKHLIEYAGMPELLYVAIGPLRILRKAYSFRNLTQRIYWIAKYINFFN
jgi:hypothetical protein